MSRVRQPFDFTRGKGFTLIELLLVVAIIGLLASIVLVTINGARSKARDAKRVSDMQSLAQALEMYDGDSGHYPISATWTSECSIPGNWIPDGSNYNWSAPYLLPQPRDPAESCSGAIQQKYSYWSDGKTYQLTTTLENSSPAGSGGSSSQTYAYNGSYFAPYVDTSPITITLSSSASNPTNQSPIPISISFSRAVSDFTQSVLSITRGVVSGFSQVLATLYNVLVTPTDNDLVVVSITGGAVHDQNGIANAPVQFTINYDSILPHVALSPDPLPASVSGPFSLSINFTVAVTDFTAGSLSVANGAVSNFVQQDGTDYTFKVTPSAPGGVSVSLPANTVHSTAGNGNVASNVLSTTYSP